MVASWKDRSKLLLPGRNSPFHGVYTQWILEVGIFSSLAMATARSTS
jgi:hypothetical protein